MIAIATKFVKATDTRCSGVRATVKGKSLFVAWQHQMSGEENHRWAALQMAVDIGYVGRFHQIDNPSSSTGWLYVCTEFGGKGAFNVGKAMTAAQHLAAA